MDRSNSPAGSPDEVSEDWTLPSPASRVLVPTLLCIFFFVYVGAEFTYGSFLTVFCVLGDLRLSPADGAAVTSVYYAAQGIAKGEFSQTYQLAGNFGQFKGFFGQQKSRMLVG